MTWKKMMQDAFDEEAFEGLTRLSADELETDMDTLMNRLEKRINPARKRNLLLYFRIAASIVLLIGIGTLLYFVFRTSSPKIVTEKSSLPVPAETKSVAVKDTPLIAENKSTKKRKQQQIPQALPENFKKSESESESASKKAAATAIVLEDEERTYSESKAPLEELVVVGYGKQMKADDSGAVSVIEAKEIIADAPVEPYGFVKPVPPGESLKAFKNWVNERIDTAQFKAFPGKYRIYILFTVQTDGTIRDIQIRNAIPAPMAEEYLRVIPQSQPWKPAMQNSTPVEAQVMVSFTETVN